MTCFGLPNAIDDEVFLHSVLSSGLKRLAAGQSILTMGVVYKMQEAAYPPFLELEESPLLHRERSFAQLPQYLSALKNTKLSLVLFDEVVFFTLAKCASLIKGNVQAHERSSAARSELHPRKLSCPWKGLSCLRVAVIETCTGIHGVNGRHVTDQDLEQFFVAVPGWKIFVLEADTHFTVRALISLRKFCPLIEARELPRKSNLLCFFSPGPQSESPLFANLQNRVLAQSFPWKNRSIRRLSTQSAMIPQ